MLWGFIALLVHLAAIWFTLGFMQEDEHFQILEFAGLKLGWTQPQLLPWEFASRIRPALQPIMVLATSRFFSLLNPYIIALIFRFFAGIFGWAVSLIFIYQASCKWENLSAKKNLYIFNAIFGFMAFFHARFSSENMAGSFCFLGLSILLMLWNNPNFKRQGVWFFLIGLAFGLATDCRIQTLFIPLGIIIWGLINRKFTPGGFLVLTLGGLMAIGVGI